MRMKSMILTLALGVPLAGTALAHMPTPEERAALFAQADADHDGKLSPTEFATLHELVRQQMAQRRFTKLDADGDGFVSQAELEAGLAKRHGRGGKCQGPQGDDS